MMLRIQYDFSMISKKVDLEAELMQFINFSASRMDNTAQKMKFSIKDFFSKYDPIRLLDMG